MTNRRILLIAMTLCLLCFGWANINPPSLQASRQAQSSQQAEESLQAQLYAAINTALSNFRLEYSQNEADSTLALHLSSVALEGNQLTIDLNTNLDLNQESVSAELLDELNHAVSNLLPYEQYPDRYPLEFILWRNGQPLYAVETPIISAAALDGVQGKRIVISPGHGRYDNKGSWPQQRGDQKGIVEDNINLDLVAELNTLLVSTGVDTRPARQLNKSAGNHRSGFPWWEIGASEYVRSLGAPESVWNAPGYSQLDRDLIARPEYANWAGAEMMVSIHNNGGGGCGTETWYQPDNGYQVQSLRLANLIQGKLVAYVRKEWNANWCNRGVKAGNYGENRRFRGPAVIVELAFMDNQSDNNALKDARFRSIAMRAIRDAVVEYYGGVASCTVPSGQFCAEYYNNRSLSGSPTFTRNEAAINSDWGNGGPGNGVGVDNFSARWQGSFSFVGGNFIFIARADDGVRVWIDNQLVIDGWRDQGATEYRATRSLSAGAHTLKMEYYENGGGAVAQLRWETAVSYERLLARHSGKCIDVNGASSATGTAIVQWDCHNGNNQAWSLVSAGNGYYKLVAKHSGKCMDVYGYSTSNGARLLQWDCNGKDNQLFKKEPVGSYFRLRAKHSNRCVDVVGGWTSNGAPLHQWDCLSVNSQQWSSQPRALVVAGQLGLDEDTAEQSPGQTEVHHGLLSEQPLMVTAPYTTSRVQHTAQEGDSLELIATTYGIPSAEIVASNPELADLADQMPAGITLNIPVLLPLTQGAEDDSANFKLLLPIVWR